MENKLNRLYNKEEVLEQDYAKENLEGYEERGYNQEESENLLYELMKTRNLIAEVEVDDIKVICPNYNKKGEIEYLDSNKLFPVCRMEIVGKKTIQVGWIK